MTVGPACTIVIASGDLLRAIEQRKGADGREVLIFSDAQAVRALEEMIRRRPEGIELERRFAATPRGIALINRIKADPALGDSEIRIVSHEGDYTRVLPRPAAVALASAAATPIDSLPTTTIESLPRATLESLPHAALADASLDQRGTRRAERFRLVDGIAMLIDGSATIVVDLSIAGAQVVSPAILKPNQRVRVGLNDDHGALRFNATIVWALFEIPANKGARYRAGLEFADADGNTLDGFCFRHKAH